MNMTEGVNTQSRTTSKHNLNEHDGGSKQSRTRSKHNLNEHDMTEGVNTQSRTTSKHSLNEMKQTEDTSTFHIIFLTTRTEEVNITSVKRAEDI